MAELYSAEVACCKLSTVALEVGAIGVTVPVLVAREPSGWVADSGPHFQLVPRGAADVPEVAVAAWNVQNTG